MPGGEPIQAAVRERSGLWLLFDAALQDVLEPGIFEPEELRRRNWVQAVSRAGRGQAIFFQPPGEGVEEWVLRHYLRGGALGRLLGDRYFWTGLERSRPWREWHYTACLYQEGLPVPRPVAARVQRHGLSYCGDLITVRIPGAVSLDDLLGRDGVSESVWRAIGACIRRFHDAGHWHADLNSRNILVDSRDDVWIIDWDRGRKRPQQFLNWRQSNLDRLKRDLEKRLRLRRHWAYSEASFQALVLGYETG